MTESPERVPQAAQWEVVLAAITIIAVVALVVVILPRASSDPAGVTGHDLRLEELEAENASLRREVMKWTSLIT